VTSAPGGTAISRPNPEPVPARLRELSLDSPEAIALAAPGRQPLSFAQLWETAQGHAAEIASGALGGPPRVAMVFPDGPELAVAFLATICAGAAAPLNPRYTQSEFESQLRSLKADLLMIDTRLESPAHQAAEAVGLPVIEAIPQLDRPAGAMELHGLPGQAGPLSMPEPEELALLLHTSGTTASPKVVPLTHANLAASAANIRSWLQLTSADRCLNVMPLFHIHGLMAALLASLTAGGSVACTPGFLAPQFFEWIDALRPTWLTAVPSMHQAILARAKQEDARPEGRLRFLRSSSAPLPPSVLADLEVLFQAPVVEAYGMTEACHQMASNPLPPGKSKPGSVGLPSGTEVAIMDPAGSLLSEGEIGEIVIRGPNVMQGYEDNPGANARAFSDGWFRTGDQGAFDQDGYLVIRGRIKELINRGGEKISPREVDEALMSHPAVDQALAFALPDGRLGEEVAAVVVLKPGQTADEGDLRRHAAERLADFKLPRRIVFQDEIPKGPTGKPQRIGLAERLGLADAVAGQGLVPAPFKPPGTPTQRALAAIWREVLKVDRVGADDRFLDLGGDSILAAQLLARVRSRLNIELSMLDFFEAETIAEQALLVEGKNRHKAP